MIEVLIPRSSAATARETAKLLFSGAALLGDKCDDVHGASFGASLNGKRLTANCTR